MAVNWLTWPQNAFLGERGWLWLSPQSLRVSWAQRLLPGSGRQLGALGLRAKSLQLLLSSIPFSGAHSLPLGGCQAHRTLERNPVKLPFTQGETKVPRDWVTTLSCPHTSGCFCSERGRCRSPGSGAPGSGVAPPECREVARQTGQGSEAPRAGTGSLVLVAEHVPLFSLLTHSSLWSMPFQRIPSLWPLPGELSTHMAALGSRALKRILIGNSGLLPPVPSPQSPRNAPLCPPAPPLLRLPEPCSPGCTFWTQASRQEQCLCGPHPMPSAWSIMGLRP